jgi:hypothetical protein
MQQTKFEFSEVELDLINEYVDKNKGVLTKTKDGRRDKFFISSDSLSACIRVTNMEERTIFVCVKVFDIYYDYWVTTPPQLKTALGL